MARILFYVQHLLGIGHLTRAGLIAEATAARGLDVTLVSGGRPVPGLALQGVTLHQLPPLAAGPGGFRDLRDAEGEAVNEDWRARRAASLLALLEETAPEVLIIEAFPFGRRQMDFELLPLLEAARAMRPRPVVVASVRDILQVERKPGRDAETLDRLEAYFDAVLVHGDARFMPLAVSFPRAGEIACAVHHTGIVAAPGSTSDAAPSDGGEVTVSNGGGAQGGALLRAALAVRPGSPIADRPWRLITGPNLDPAEDAAIRAQASGDVMVDRFRADFRQCLGRAGLSLSYAGYNTVADLLRADLPAVVISFSGDGGESEQAMRAARLEELGLAVWVPDSELTAERLAMAIDRALALPRTARPRIDLEGARRSAELIARWALARRQ